MKQIILEVLEDVSLNRQLNMQAEGARQMVADKLEEKLQPHVNQLIEEILVGISKEYRRLKEDEPI